MVSTTLLPTIGVVHMLYPSWKAEFLDPVCVCVFGVWPIIDVHVVGLYYMEFILL